MAWTFNYDPVTKTATASDGLAGVSHTAYLDVANEGGVDGINQFWDKAESKLAAKVKTEADAKALADKAMLNLTAVQACRLVKGDVSKIGKVG
jgi:hypothetical protein